MSIDDGHGGPEVCPRKRLVYVGVWQGQGPPPGYEWTVLIHRYAFEDAMECLDEDQYEYASFQVRDLAMHRDPSHSDTLSIDKIETFYELRMKGGGIGPRVNGRVYFDLVDGSKAIRILGFDIKKNEGHISEGVKEKILRRQRRWSAGVYPMFSVRTVEASNRVNTGGKGR